VTRCGTDTLCITRVGTMGGMSILASMAGLTCLLAPDLAWAQMSSWDWGQGPHWLGWLLLALVAWFALLVIGAWALAYLAPVVLAVVAGVLGLRWLLRGGGRHDQALEILRERYARGEISREEFEARRRDLTS